jgi:hypothetical protein
MAKPKELNQRRGQHLSAESKLEKLVRTMEKAIERERAAEKREKCRETR